MDTYYKVKLAYLLGCKVAEVQNANALAQRLNSLDKKEESRESEMEDSDIMSNGEFRRQTEAGTQYGPKHQIAITPEWAP